MKIIDDIKKTEQPVGADSISARTQSRATSVAIGCFDGLHLGHQAVIHTAVTAAASRGLTSAVFTFRMGGSRPAAKGSGDLFTEVDKQALLAQLGVGFYIAPAFEEVAGLDGEAFVKDILFKKYRAAVICCGTDFRFGRGRACGVEKLAALCRAADAELVLVPAVLDDGEPISSTRIKAALAAGQPETAARMLGRFYALRLPVHAEKRLAGRLGFPTINQRFPDTLALPRPGVYYTRVLTDDGAFSAVSNLGRRPTVGGTNVTLETHILDYNGQLYGREVAVELRHFLRDERHFENLEALKRAVEQDIAAVRSLANMKNEKMN